jgi:hypothetical protein
MTDERFDAGPEEQPVPSTTDVDAAITGINPDRLTDDPETVVDDEDVDPEAVIDETDVDPDITT